MERIEIKELLVSKLTPFLRVGHEPRPSDRMEDIIDGDSLTVIEVSMEIEDLFAIEISDRELLDLVDSTLDDVVTFVERRLETAVA